jgi:hypothetical protein
MDQTVRGHHVIGGVHELTPEGGSAAALEALLHHECDVCHGMRVVIDLTDGGVTDEEIEVLLDLVDPTQERWVVRLPLSTAAATVERLEKAGFGGRLISDESTDVPHHLPEV